MYYSDYNRPQDGIPSVDFQPVPPETPEPPKKKKGKGWLKVTALVLACALVGGGAGIGGAMWARSTTSLLAANQTTVYEGNGSPAVVNLSKVSGGQVLSAAEVYASNVNSTVGITTQVTTNVWGQQVASAASGSGFVITQDGYIITNYHVVEDATSINVTFCNGDSFPATLVGSEAENDIAVLKIDATGLTPVRLGSSTDLVVGEEVVAIGNPLGELTFTMTGGMVSALDRTITMSDGTALNVLQTDAAINSGNSGGPLFNMYGQVIGITNAKYSNNGSSAASIEGISFAIPIDDVKAMVYDIMEHGYVTGKPYVGVTLATANANNAAQFGRAGGAYVQSVVKGAAADKAGLQQGDIITAVDGETIEGHADFIEIKNHHRAGDTVTLTVDRAGRNITLQLTFDEQKPSDQVGAVQGGAGSNPYSGEPGSGNQNGGNQSGGNQSGGSQDDYSDFWNFLNPFGW